MKEYILYGTKKGDPQWKEQILKTGCNESNFEKTFEKVQELARKDGFDRFRIFIYNGEQPDFSDSSLLNV